MKQNYIKCPVVSCSNNNTDNFKYIESWADEYDDCFEFQCKKCQHIFEIRYYRNYKGFKEKRDYKEFMLIANYIKELKN